MAQIIEKYYILDHENEGKIKMLKAISDEENLQDVCLSSLADIYDIYKKVSGDLKPIITDKIH